MAGVHFRRHPGTSVRVFLEHPTDSTRRTHVGTLSFFSSPHHGHGDDDWRFDATVALQALGLEGTGTFDVCFSQIHARQLSRRGSQPPPGLVPNARRRQEACPTYLETLSSCMNRLPRSNEIVATSVG
jgi:hypothetical protein